ncbi:MAG: hypothetical protein QM785_05325 [Pyrinomonadaceae bacterium]
MLVKKYITAFTMAILMAVAIPAFAGSASAQTTRYYRSSNGSVYKYKKPNVYRRHRKAFNIGIGTGIGALVGGLLGGKKGVVIGGLAGAGGGALFTHKQQPKNYYRRVYVRPRNY